MKKIILSTLIATLIIPSSALALNTITTTKSFSLNFEKILVTYKPTAEPNKKEAALQICQQIVPTIQKFQEVSGINLKSKGTEVAMEELVKTQSIITVDICHQIMAAKVAFAPLKPAEFIGTSMATPALTASNPRNGGAYGDHIGNYNFMVEISGISAGK